MLLFKQQKITMKELAQKIHRSKPTVTVLIDKLVKFGYVHKEKSDKDSRITYISLSEKGKGFEKDFEEISQKLNNTIFLGVQESEKDEVEKILEKILQNLL